MTNPALLGVATAVPQYRYEQMDLYERFMSKTFNSRRAPAIFRSTEIESRYSVIDDPDWLSPNPGAETRNQLYIQSAPPLGVQAIQNALRQAQLSPDQIDDFMVVSCTGIDTPGIDIPIAKSLGLAPHVRRANILGMGCHALLPALYRAMISVTSRPDSKVLILTVELCTLHLQHDSSLQNMLGSALFGDGASAVVVGTADDNPAHPRLLDHMAYTDYDRPEDIAFHPGDTGYRIKLSTKIPKILRKILPSLIEPFLQRNQLQLSDIQHWLVHPGGIKILDYVEQVLELDQDELVHSRAVLREYGNMSSATLLFVLQKLMQNQPPQPGDYGVMMGFGSGLSIEFVLLQW